MPAPNGKPGLSELQQSLQNIGRSTLREGLGAGLTDKDYAALAARFYDSPDPGKDPVLQGWLQDAAFHDPEYALQAHRNLPALQYADVASRAAGLGPAIDPDYIRGLELTENSLAGGRGFGANDVGPYAGHGWSREEINKARERTGNPEWMPAAFELSPGDYERHQRLRDINFLTMMAQRRQGGMQIMGREVSATPGASWDPTGLFTQGGRPGASWFTGGDWATDVMSRPPYANDDQIAKNERARVDQRTKDALYWRQKGQGAKYASGDGQWLSTNKTANFPQYGGWLGTAAATDNPDYTFGSLSQNVFTPMEYSLNKLAMGDIGEGKDSEAMAYVRGAGPGGFLAASLLDTIHNGLNYKSDRTPMEDAMAMATHGNINRASPLLPTKDYAPDPYQRSRLASRARELQMQALNPTATEYYRDRTGKQMSLVGQVGASLGSAMLDPTIFLQGAFAKPGARAARVAAEATEEWPGSFLIAGATLAGAHKKPTAMQALSPQSWMGENAERPDLPPEAPGAFEKRMQDFRPKQDRALQEIRRLNEALPGRAPIPSPGAPNPKRAFDEAHPIYRRSGGAF